MNDAVTWFQIAVALISISGALAGVWWRLQNQISTNRADADKELATYKLHVAEHYVSKQGHRETMDQVMEAIASVKQSIDGTNLRIDRMWEAGSSKTTSRAIK